MLGCLLFPTIFNFGLTFLDCSIRQFCKEQLHELKIDKKCPKWRSIQLEWEPRIIPSIEEGVGWGSKVMTTDLLSVVTVRRKCKQLLQSVAHLLQRLWHKSFHQPSFNLTPFWDVCLSARKYLITFEYKGSSLATKEIILKYCIQRSFPLLILFFLLNPMNVSWDRWY